MAFQSYGGEAPMRKFVVGNIYAFGPRRAEVIATLNGGRVGRLRFNDGGEEEIHWELFSAHNLWRKIK
jgi:hypothetical protein